MLGFETIIAQQSSGGNTLPIFSPWFRRQADNAIFSYYQIQKLTGAGNLNVKVFHKNENEMGEGAEISSTFVQEGNSCVYWTSTPVSGLKELVRYKVYAAFSSAEPTYGVVFRFLEPTWFNSAVE